MRGAAAQAAVVESASEFVPALNVTVVCHNVVLVSKLTDLIIDNSEGYCVIKDILIIDITN